MRDTAILIDGPNLYNTAKLLDLEIDFKQLRDYFSATRNVIRANYYTAMTDSEEYTSIKPLIDWLSYNRYVVVTKPSKTFVDADGRKRVKGNMDIDIAVDAIVAAEWAEEIILFTGDGDFRPLVEEIQRRKTIVTVVSSIQTEPAVMADELRRQVDEFIDLATIAPAVAKQRRAQTDRRVA
jgi:uncharacterized LabA/DUF88 family protein